MADALDRRLARFLQDVAGLRRLIPPEREPAPVFRVPPPLRTGRPRPRAHGD